MPPGRVAHPDLPQQTMRRLRYHSAVQSGAAQLKLFSTLVAIVLLTGCASREPINAFADAAEIDDAPVEALKGEDGADAGNEQQDPAEREEVAAAIQSSVPSEPATIEPFDDIVVHLHEPSVEVRGWVALDGGFLEQIACSPGTREHESLIVIRARPSNVHAALLLAGFEPGSPGRWTWNDALPEGEQLQLIEPQGNRLDVLVRYERAGEVIEEPIRNWVRDFHDMDRSLPEAPWVFGGSLFKENPPQMGPGHHYVADYSGSIIGLVTFGDEVVGFMEIMPDQEEFHAPEWEVDIDRIPPVGTPVTVILRPYPSRGTEEAVDLSNSLK